MWKLTLFALISYIVKIKGPLLPFTTGQWEATRTRPYWFANIFMVRREAVSYIVRKAIRIKIIELFNTGGQQVYVNEFHFLSTERERE